MDQLYKYNGITLRRMNRVQFKEHYFQRKQKRSQAFDDQRFLMACDDSLNEEQPENAEKELNSNIKCRGKTRIPVRCVSKTCDGTRRILTCVTEEKPKPFVVGKVRHKIHSPPFLHNPLKTSEAKTPYLPMTYQSVIPENYKFTAPKGLPHFKYTTPKTSENSPFTLKSLLLPRIKRFTNSPLEQEHTERSLHKVKRELWIDEEPPIFGRTNVAKALEKEYNKDLDSQDGVAIVPSTSNSVQKMCTNSNIDSEKIEKSVSMSFEFEKDESFVDKENISSNDVRKTEKATQYSSQMDELQTSLKYFDADANREVEKENQAEAVEKSINRLNESKSSKQISESCVPTRYQSHIPVKHHGSISMHEENLILSNKKSNTNICNKPLVSMSKGVPIIQNTSECMMHSNKQLNHKITGQDSITFSEGVSTFPKMIIECTRSPERIAKKIEKLCDGLDECPITVLKKPSEKIMKTEVIDLVSDEEEEDSYKTFIQRVLNNCAKHQRLSNACATSPLLNSKTNISPVETPKVGRRNKKEASANSSLVASHLTPKTNVIPVETPKVGRRKKKEASANFSASALPHTPKINISPAKTPKVVGRKKKEASANSSLRPSLVTPQTNISPVKTPKVGRRKKKEASENSSPGPFLLTTQTNISPVKTPKVVGRKKKEASENSSMGPSLLIPEINISPAKTPKVVGRKKKEALANSSPGTSLLTPVRVLSLRSRNVEVSPSPSKSTPRRRRKKDEVRV
ncbi:hypothetical protein TKK_0016869 [Trichogramma kaykai]